MTGIILSKGGGAERCVEIRSLEVPDLWHIAMALGETGNPVSEEKVLEAWHLAHDMKNALQAIDKTLPKMLGRATERLREYITDIQEMGDVEQRTVDNLKQWAEELAEFMKVFEYFPMGGDFMGDERNDAETYIGEALRLAEELAEEIKKDMIPEYPLEEDYTNHYKCTCGHRWSMAWSCACNDKCERCGREIEPEVQS